MTKKTKFTLSYMAIIPAVRRDAVNAALEQQGYGPDNFSVPLVGRNDPVGVVATHYGCDARADSDLERDISNTLDREVPPGLKKERKAPKDQAAEFASFADDEKLKIKPDDINV